jgi:hypothetical protein
LCRAACADFSQIQVDTAPSFIVFEIHNLKTIPSGPELNLPIPILGPRKLAADIPVAGLESDELGHHLVFKKYLQVHPFFIR